MPRPIMVYASSFQFVRLCSIQDLVIDGAVLPYPRNSGTDRQTDLFESENLGKTSLAAGDEPLFKQDSILLI